MLRAGIGAVLLFPILTVVGDGTVSTLPAAPVPAPKSRPTLTGKWFVYWNDYEPWVTDLDADGSYTARRERPERWSGKQHYKGRWSLKGDTLTIEEINYSDRGEGHPQTYTFTLLPSSLRSKDGAVRFEPYCEKRKTKK